MIVGFSRHGKGSGRRAVNYLASPINPVTKEQREVIPEVLKGDLEEVSKLIDSLDFKHKYTSGVLSFAPGEVVTPEIEKEIISEFEKRAFAGLREDQYTALWVRHAHAGHHELHFLVPRVELSTGKSLNIRPPGSQAKELFDSYRSLINERYGFSDPDDPARARVLKLPEHQEKLRASDLRKGVEGGQDPRELLTNYLTKQIEEGLITSRDGLISHLKEQGFQVPRSGKDYITVLDQESGEKWRLRGVIYEHTFQSLEHIRGERKAPEPGDRKHSEEYVRELETKLNRLTEARARFHKERYRERVKDLSQRVQKDTHELSKGDELSESVSEISVDRGVTSGDVSLSRYMARELGDTVLLRAQDSNEERGTREIKSGTLLPERGVEEGSISLRRGEETDVSSDRTKERLRSNVWESLGGIKDKVTELYDRTRETVTQSLRAIREGLQRTREQFNEALGRLDHSVRHWSESHGRVVQAGRESHKSLQLSGRDFEENLKRVRWKILEKDRGIGF